MFLFQKAETFYKVSLWWILLFLLHFKNCITISTYKFKVQKNVFLFVTKHGCFLYPKYPKPRKIIV